MKRILLSIALLLYSTTVNAAPIQWVSTSVMDNTVRWDMQFLGVPDFKTVDEFNRQKDSFQVFITGNALGLQTTEPYNQVQSLIRGEELHLLDGIPVRNVFEGADTQDMQISGGWGSVRERVDVVQMESFVSFQTSLLGLHTNAPFHYAVGGFDFGAEPITNVHEHGYMIQPLFEGCVSDTRCAIPLVKVPEPNTFLLFAMSIVALVVWRRLRGER